MLVPTICFNCEAACGLVAYVDKRRWQVRKLEGNPHHPGSRGSNCAKGPATINQINDPERILYPLKRVGPRGSGQFERATWDEVLDTFAAQIRAGDASRTGAPRSCTTSAGPATTATWTACSRSWGVDGHNCHTNVCSAAARLGYALWSGADRPSPDHAQREVHPAALGAPRDRPLLQPARAAHHRRQDGGREDLRRRRAALEHRVAWPTAGSRRGRAPRRCCCSRIAHVLLEEDLFDRQFVEHWVNWRELPGRASPGARARRSTRFIDGAEASTTRTFTPETRRRGVRRRRRARFATVGAGDRRGRQRVRDPRLAQRRRRATSAAGRSRAACSSSCVLVGRGRTPGAARASTSHNKFVPAAVPQAAAAEGLERAALPARVAARAPRAVVPAAALPRGGPRQLDAYFTRVYNPVWTNPDGMMWEQVLARRVEDRAARGADAVWNETAQCADYVLPMGVGAERHDLMSQETHAATWIGFRQPVAPRRARARGRARRVDLRGEPRRGVGGGRVLDRAVVAHRSGRRARHPPATSSRPTARARRSRSTSTTAGSSRTPCPACPRRRRKHGLTPLEYMRRYGAFLVERGGLRGAPEGARRRAAARARRSRDGDAAWCKDGTADRRSASDGSRARRLRDAVAPARDLQSDDGGVGLARARAAGLHREPHPPAAPRPRARRVRAGADVPPADADPHALGQRQVAVRALQHEPGLDPPRGRRAPRRRDRRPRAREHAHRPLRQQGLGHRGHAPRRRRVLAPPRPLAPVRRRRHRPLGERQGRARGARAGRLPLPPRGGHPALRERRPRHASASGGPTAACTRTSPSRSSPTRSPACTAGTSG